MELIENPELKSMYDKCKYRVKLWEYNFKKQHGRLPSKVFLHSDSFPQILFIFFTARYSRSRKGGTFRI